VLAALLLAATLPLGVWPSDVGPAATVVDDVEFYVVDPEDDYYILAVEPLLPPLATAEPAALKRLAALAHRLGADGVVLLAELSEDDIPDDLEESLPPGRRFTVAVFLCFDTAADGEESPKSAATRAWPGSPGAAANGGNAPPAWRHRARPPLQPQGSATRSSCAVAEHSSPARRRRAG
jgi:hypothetical protein